MGAMYVCVRTCRAGHEGSSVPDSKEVDALLLHSELDVSEFFAQLGSRDADATKQLGLEERGNLHR